MLIANIIASFVFLFLYWKRLKEDYASEKIFNTGIIFIFSINICLLITSYILHGYWFWFVMLGLVLLELVNVFKFKFKLFESLDALIISSFSWLFVYCLSLSIFNKSLIAFIASWVSLMCIFLFFLIDNYYKTFTWYKSGRIGFSGSVVLGLFFLIRIVFSFLVNNIDIISFAPKYEIVFSGSFVLLSFLLLYNLFKLND